MYGILSKLTLNMTVLLIFTLAGKGGGLMQPPLGVPKITREQIGGSSRNFIYLIFKQYNIFPEDFKTLPTMTFDLCPDFQGNAKRNLRSVPLQHLKLANFVTFAGDIDM